MKNSTKFKGNARKLLAILAAGLATLAIPLASAQEKKGMIQDKVVVQIDDLQGQIDARLDSPREDLLAQAFTDAASRSELIGDYELEYNSVLPNDARGYLEFNVIRWERSVANMYEFTATATYHDLDGKEINLGTFHGKRSGINVVTRYDIGENFAGSAQDAFEQALKKLEERLS